MTEAREIQSVIHAAERAAAVNDYVSAEQLLAEAASLQEASLGPLHPDLANTLNNLGVVCEITEKPLEAERHFRRAFAIATASLPPDHPFVATSRKNLEDFCSSRGIAFEPQAATPVSSEPELPAAEPPLRPEVRATEPTVPPLELVVAPAEPIVPAVEPVPPPIESADLRVGHAWEIPLPAAPGRWSRPVVIGAVIAGALLVAILATVLRRGEPAPTGASIESADDKAPVGTAPQAGAASPTTPPGRRGTTAAAASRSRATTATASKPPIVAAAQLCGELARSGEWRCVPPRRPTGPGALYFYSRLKSATDTTVQHRWYQGDRLRQSVMLPIKANAVAGYRTFSRQTVADEGAAEWRVELRTKDGALLHEERFAVR